MKRSDDFYIDWTLGTGTSATPIILGGFFLMVAVAILGISAGISWWWALLIALVTPTILAAALSVLWLPFALFRVRNESDFES